MVDTRVLFAALVLSAGTLAAIGVAVQTQVGGPADGADTTPAVSVVGAELPGETPADEPMQISVTLAADTGQPGTHSVRLHAAGESGEQVLASRDVRLSDDGERRVVFDVPGGALDPGEYRLRASVGDWTDRLGATTVVEPAALVVRGADMPRSAVLNDSVAVRATVRNDGGYNEVRPVRFQVDADGDGAFDPSETVADTSLTLPPGETTRVQLRFPTPALDPGSYRVRVTTPSGAETGRIGILAPARLAVTDLNASTDVTRGTDATVAGRVRNLGDVPGEGSVDLVGPAGAVGSVDVSLDPNETAPFEFAVPTGDKPRGNYSYRLTAAENTSLDLRVREPSFGVSNLRGNETLIVGDPMVFAADITNDGDANGTATVAYRIDLDDDDRPEEDNITRQVTLAPGEERTVRFRIPYLADPDPLNQVEDLPAGTYIYGIYTADDNETSVFEARPPASGGGFGGSAGGGTDGSGDPGPVSKAEISQDKYGVFYEQLSEQTRRQVDEIHVRQPFAGDLGVTDVLTREEIAQQKYGVRVRPGEDFEFSALDIRLQQRIEADFEAQFTRDRGDRIESWDELAREEYGRPYDDLIESRKEAVREAYRDQFD